MGGWVGAADIEAWSGGCHPAVVNRYCLTHSCLNSAVLPLAVQLEEAVPREQVPPPPLPAATARRRCCSCRHCCQAGLSPRP